MNDPQSTINLLVERLAAEFSPKKIILFGSYAWGKPTLDSDIDLCVIVESSSEKPIDRKKRARSVLIDIPVAKDILVKTESEMLIGKKVLASLECHILEMGKVVYEC